MPDPDRIRGTRQRHEFDFFRGWRLRRELDLEKPGAPVELSVDRQQSREPIGAGADVVRHRHTTDRHLQDLEGTAKPERDGGRGVDPACRRPGYVDGGVNLETMCGRVQGHRQVMMVNDGERHDGSVDGGSGDLRSRAGSGN